MSPLPIDVLTDILVRLPAKSLLRFKCVCKLRYEIINGSDFIRLHVKQSNLHIVFRTPVLRLSDFDTFGNSIELDYPFKAMDFTVRPYYMGVYVRGSCRGILCFSMLMYPFTTCLYYPTTRTLKTLPFLPIKSPFCYPKGSNYLGFGYDHKSEDYKCVRILLCSSDDDVGSFKSQVTVYSLRADSWRCGAHDVPFYFYSHERNCVYFDGILRWSIEDDHRRPLPIVSFNLSDESFSSIPLPIYHKDDFYMRAHLGVVDECLCIMINYFDYCDVWVMKEYGIPASWTRLFRVAKRENYEDLRPICFLKSRKQLLVYISLANVASLDLENMEITNLPAYNRIWSVYLCSENLLMLKDDEDVLVSSRKLRKKNAKRQKLMRKTERILQHHLQELCQPH